LLILIRRGDMRLNVRLLYERRIKREAKLGDVKGCCACKLRRGTQ